MRQFSSSDHWEDAEEEARERHDGLLKTNISREEFVDADEAMDEQTDDAERHGVPFKSDGAAASGEAIGESSDSDREFMNHREDKGRHDSSIGDTHAETSPSSVTGISASEPVEVAVMAKEDISKRLAEAIAKKEEGNAEFVKGEYVTALEIYSEAMLLSVDKAVLEASLPDDSSSSATMTDLDQGGRHAEEDGSQDDNITLKRRMNHERAIILANIAACYMKQEKWEQAVKQCTKSIESNDAYLKAYVRRAQAREKIGDASSLAEALKDYQTILTLDPSNPQARAATHRLPREIEAKQELEKQEMMGKLKDIGNKLLGKFGLSTENFQFVKDPATGGYSVNFKR